MHKNTLLVKTEKGRDAMARRVPELGPRLRSMLILVDGKRSMSELEKLGAGLGGGAALLEQLKAHGWIADRDLSAPFLESAPYVDSQPFQATAPPPVATVSPVTTGSRMAPILSFADARRLVVRFVNDAMGPMGEQAALRVESCKSAAELQSQLPRVRDALQNFRGRSTVESFDLDIVPQLPLL